MKSHLHQVGTLCHAKVLLFVTGRPTLTLLTLPLRLGRNTYNRKINAHFSTENYRFSGIILHYLSIFNKKNWKNMAFMLIFAVPPTPLPAKFINLNTKFINFNTKFIIFNTKIHHFYSPSPIGGFFFFFFFFFLTGRPSGPSSFSFSFS